MQSNEDILNSCEFNTNGIDLSEPVIRIMNSPFFQMFLKDRTAPW